MAILFQELVKNCDKNLKDFAIIEKALQTMTNIAHHINEMKRKHEDAVRVQVGRSISLAYPGESEGLRLLFKISVKLNYVVLLLSVGNSKINIFSISNFLPENS